MNDLTNNFANLAVSNSNLLTTIYAPVAEIPLQRVQPGSPLRRDPPIVIQGGVVEVQRSISSLANSNFKVAPAA